MTSAALRLADDVVIDSAMDGHRIVHHRTTSRYFRLGTREATFLAGLDGRRTEAEVKADTDFGPEQVDALLAWFRQHRLLCESAVDDAEHLPKGWTARLLLGWDDWRITLWYPNDFLDRHRSIVDGFFGRGALAAYLLAVVSPALLLILDPALTAPAVRRFSWSLQAWTWVLLYLSILLTVALHELAHGATCKRLGGRVGRIGVKLMYLQPVAFCDISDSWRLRSRSGKILVASAGIIIQCVLSGVALSAWLLTGEPFFAHYALANTMIAALNLFPLTKLDGYWILVHLLDEPNLRRRGLEAIAARLSGRGGVAAAQDRTLLIFGAAHVIVLPFVWLLGLATVYRIGSWASPLLAFALTAVAAMLLVHRAWQAIGCHLGTHRSPDVG